MCLLPRIINLDPMWDADTDEIILSNKHLAKVILANDKIPHSNMTAARRVDVFGAIDLLPQTLTPRMIRFNTNCQNSSSQYKPQ